VPDALAINAYYLQQAQGGRHVLLIGDKKGHNCGFSIRKSSNVKPTVYWGKAVLLSYEISAPRTLLPPNNNYRDTDPLPAHLKPVMPAIKWMTGEDHTVFTNAPGPCIPTQFGFAVRTNPVSCAKCHKPNFHRMRCNKCQSVYYCGKACQKADWPRHEEICPTKMVE